MVTTKCTETIDWLVNLSIKTIGWLIYAVNTASVTLLYLQTLPIDVVWQHKQHHV